MTLQEKVGLLHAPMALTPGEPPGAIGSAACTVGLERLGIPTFQESDAGLGVANPGGVRPDDVATALPCGLLTGATFDPDLARRGGVVVGEESRATGFAIQLAGGANLIREPRGGRSFEYVGEDPLLTGALTGAAIAGIQSRGVASTVKHFALNAQETGRVMVSSEIGEAALRESDLLAFQIAIERGRPGAVMTAYNAVDGEHASESRLLLARVLKGDWAYPGVVMSDWGGTHSAVAAARAGLDRQSGWQLDPEPFFGDALADAVRDGRVAEARVDDMLARLLRTLIVSGALDDGRTPGAVDPAAQAAHGDEAQAVAEQGIVLLRNDGTLPLQDATRVALIGGHADVGTLSGGGSSQVVPAGSTCEEGLRREQHGALPRVYHPSVPLRALRDALPGAEVTFDDGGDHAAAAAAAARADVAVVVVEQWMTEGRDAPDLRLPGEQDALISAVVAANPRTVAVLETGGPVLMPWLDDVAAVVEAWYGGSRGAEALAGVLAGAVNPSGRLPVSFPRGVEQLPRPALRDPTTTTSDPGLPRTGPFSVDYEGEGSDVGYRWYRREGLVPLFPFGHGLSYTTFSYADLAVDVDADGTPQVSLTVANAGARAGIDTPQVYVMPPPETGAGAPRLSGWARVALAAGEERRVTIVLDEPRVLARYDPDVPGWSLAAGSYAVEVGRDAGTPVLSGRVELPARRLAP